MFQHITRFQRWASFNGFFLGRWPRLLHFAPSALSGYSFDTNSEALGYSRSVRFADCGKNDFCSTVMLTIEFGSAKLLNPALTPKKLRHFILLILNSNRERRFTILAHRVDICTVIK